MTQVCSLVELLLVDVREIDAGVIWDLVEMAGSRGVLRGAIGTSECGPDAKAALARHSDVLEFWLFSDNAAWPFGRALAFSGVEPERALFVCGDEVACEAARAAGLTTGALDIAALERLLP